MNLRLGRRVSRWVAGGAVAAPALLLGGAGHGAEMAEAVVVGDPPAGFVVVDKVVTGDAGLAEDITIRVSCEQVPDFGDATYDETQTIPAGTTAITLTFGPIASPADCTATEIVDGSSGAATVEVDGLPVSFRLNPNEDYTIGVSNEVTALTGNLQISKVSLGSMAELRGDVTVEVSCTDPAGVETETTVVLPPATIVTRTVSGLVATSQCDVVEVDDGSPPGAVVDTAGSGQTVTVVAGGTTRAAIVNTYREADGWVQVVKQIDDPTSERGDVVIEVICGGNVVGVFDVPPGAGPFTSPAFVAPAGATCAAVETQDGATTSVAASVTIDPSAVVVAGGTISTITVTNEYSTVPPDTVDVTLTKEVAGQSGLQGPVLVVAVCGGRPGALVVPAGSGVGPTSSVITDVPAGATCAVAEPLAGANDEVDVSTAGTGADLIPVDGAITVTNTYSTRPGSVRVRKLVSGSAASTRGAVTVLVDCDNGASSSATFQPGDPLTDVVLTDLPAGTTCRVTEPANGSTATTAVTVSGAPAEVVISAGREEIVVVDNVYEPRVGSLTVFKQTRGPAADYRGDVVIDVSCDDGTEDIIVAPAGAPIARSTYPSLPVGTTCTISETTDGSTSAVAVATEPDQPADVEITEGYSVVRLTNTYTATPGSLTVAKEVVGSAASRRGDVTIQVRCTSASTSFTLPAGATGPSSLTLDGLFPGETCAVTETASGAREGVVDVSTSYVPAATVVVGPAETVVVTVVNSYADAAPSPTTPTTTPVATSTTTVPAPTPTTTLPTGADGPPLPATGASPSALVPAAVLLLAGVTLLLTIRRRFGPRSVAPGRQRGDGT